MKCRPAHVFLWANLNGLVMSVFIQDYLSISDGTLIDSGPADPDLFGDVKGIHYSSDESLLFVIYGTAIDESLVIANQYDSTDGTFGTENVLADQNILALGDHFYVGDQNVIVDSVGRVVTYNATTILENRTKEESIAAIDFITTDEAIKAAGGDSTSFYVATTIDNTCHQYNPGTLIREWAPSGSNFVTNSNVIAVSEDVHSLVSYDSDLFVFWGEAGDFSGDNSSDIVQPTVDTSEFNPLVHDFDPSFAKSAISNDDTKVIMQIDDGCEHHLLRWDTVTNSYLDSIEVYWNIDDFSYSRAQNRVYMATNFDDGFFIYYVDFNEDVPQRRPLVSGDNSDGQYAGSIGKMVATDNQLVFQASLDDGNPLNVVVANEVSFANDAFENCCDTWTNAVWDSGNKRIIYTTAFGMYQMTMTEPGNLDDPVSFSVPTVSPYYAVTQAASAEGVMSLNSDGSKMFYRGIIYDVPSLDYSDATLRTPELAAWVGGDLYTMENAGDEMLMWEFASGTDSHTGDPEAIAITSGGALLLPMDNTGTEIPLSVSVSSGKALTFSEHVSAEEVNSTTVGGDGSGSDDSDDTSGSGSSEPAAPIGGTGGGSIDYIYLLLLTLGFAAKRRTVS